MISANLVKEPSLMSISCCALRLLLICTRFLLGLKLFRSMVARPGGSGGSFQVLVKMHLFLREV